jgi:hypothetical protein
MGASGDREFSGDENRVNLGPTRWSFGFFDLPAECFAQFYNPYF